VVRSSASKAAMPAFIEALQGSDYQSAIAGYIDRVLFLPTDDAARRAQITAAMPATARHVMVAALQGMWAFDPDEAIGRVRAPSLYLAADETPLSDVPRLRELVPNLAFGQTVGSGHFCQLEVPEQVNPMIERFLAVAPSLGPT